ncbi:MAG: hypothetical protein WD078_01815 [Woeseia sp.]
MSTQRRYSAELQELPDHLARMALFKVNTGCREQQVCGLRPEWEIEVPEIDTSSEVESRHGHHRAYGFTCDGRR